MDPMSQTSNDDADTITEDAGPLAAATRALDSASGEVDPQRAARVRQICDKIRKAETYHGPAFKRIDDDIKFAANLKGAQWSGDEDKYVANLTLRHIQDRTAALYAKNPRVRAKRKERLDFAIWDEKAETFQAAFMNMQTFMAQAQQNQAATGMPPPPMPPELVAFAQDIMQGKQKRDMIDRIGRTLTILYHHYLDEPQPRFKRHMKSAVKRAITCGISWVKLSYQRAYDKNPGVIDQINDITLQISRIEALNEDVADGEIEDGSPQLEELKQSLASLQSQATVLVNEGLVHTFPRHDRVIMDPMTEQIGGFVGTKWMAHKFLLTEDQVEAIYGVDISEGSGYSRYTMAGGVATAEAASGVDGAQCMACVYEYYDKPSGTFSVVCEGYSDYLKEPSAPPILVKRFFPFFPIMFNELENPRGEIYPPSDVRLIEHQQREHNRSREALRQHRIASQPFYLSTQGQLDEEDKTKIGNRVPHAVHEIKGMPPGTKAEDIIQPMKTVPIDPNLYEVGPIFQDIERTTGQQQANFGGTSDASATEASISEGSRLSTLSSANDDLEEALTEMARAGGETLLLEADPQTVQKIVGVGAMWPQMSRQDFADDVYLEVIAGSNGRPNRAQEIANIERLAPVIVQTPGFNPNWLARKLAMAMDPEVDLAEALLDGAPSMIAQNAASKTAAMAPGSSTQSAPNTPAAAGAPAAQGDHGGNNASAPAPHAPGPQPAYPAAGHA